jgi:hypothetical protein
MRSLPRPHDDDDTASQRPADFGDALVSQDALHGLELVIERGLQTFIAVGAALMVIREQRLYRTDGYDTFEEYCRERWGWGRNYTNKLISASEIVAELGTTVPSPTSERQVRELARLPDPDARREVWQQVVEDYGDDITAAKVHAKVDERLRPKTTAEWEATPISVLGDDLPPPPYIPPAEKFMYQLTGVAIRALSTSIDDAVEGIGDGSLSDTELLPKFQKWLSDLANALSNDKKIRRLP